MSLFGKIWGGLRSLGRGIKEIARTPWDIIKGTKGVVTGALESVREQMPQIIRAAAIAAPQVAGQMLGGPAGAAAGGIVSQAMQAGLGGPQAISDAALGLAQQAMGGWTPPISSLVPGLPGVPFPLGR